MRGVYVLKTPNTSEFPKGQYYIGSTVNIKNRMRTHMKETKYQRMLPHIYNVFANHGWENIILSGQHIDNKCSNKELKALEGRYISLYRNRYGKAVINKADLDENGKLIQSNETKNKISKSRTGFKVAEETKQKIKDFWDKNGHSCLGRVYSKETLEKMSKSQKGKGGKVAYCYDLDGNFLEKFNTVAEAKKKYGQTVYDILSVKKASKQTKGVTFSYLPPEEYKGLCDR